MIPGFASSVIPQGGPSFSAANQANLSVLYNSKWTIFANFVHKPALHPMGTNYSITAQFGKALAILLADKIATIAPQFPSERFVRDVAGSIIEKTYTQRVALIADKLHEHFPGTYQTALTVFMKILGPPNPNETGMFTHYYWILPIGKFVEKYGLDHFQLSMDAIAEITRRNTGEYAVRPYIRKYPEASLAIIRRWASSGDFHLRRLASEGLRPKLPWAPKLDTFNHHPQPVFEVLEMLKEDNVTFVKKSVANHLTDWLKVNNGAATALIRQWAASTNPHTQWIIKRATRKITL
ncbi:3-methyladenine DNA glycosylase AlkC [Parapedobacter composti]|uniref:3-methyladenine DNA glycosylase AlkC n=2 Tax=Parapedobacter composti TaxID=623281 RepID=A0A1I1LQY8_9SPHI|nr:3-methyladenine DNA glycosylase AlkC [Parapedobacter composti]